MRYYFAPLEGLTDSIYRRLHHQYFPGVDRYYMPFLSPTIHHSLTAKERRNLPPADSVPFIAIPQVLTKSVPDFLWAANCFQEQGYPMINLNIGCPSQTVTAKGKGAGMLADLSSLKAFLDEIFQHSPIPISIKTRIGLKSEEEFPAILELLNQYPVAELVIHPRIQKAFYRGDVNLSAFAWALEHGTMPICYNGNVCTNEDITRIQAKFPSICGIMIGRGLIGNPGLLTSGGATRQQLLDFHDHLLEEYCVAFESKRNAMFRMKENWRYLLCLFENGDGLGKKLRKTTDYGQYMAITREILCGLPLREELHPDW